MRIGRLMRGVLSLACAAAASPSAPSWRTSAAAECGGDACPRVSVTYGEAKQRYRVRNGSPDRRARVAASNLAAAAAACVRPGRDEYLTLRSIVGPYRAGQAGPRCGGQGVGR